MKSTFLLGWLSSLISLSWAHAQVTVSVGKITNSRSEIKSSSIAIPSFLLHGLSVQLELHGNAIATARSLHLTVTSALDDTGADLSKSQFDGMSGLLMGNSQYLMTLLNLKDPAPAAKAIAVLKGEVQLFEPQTDPASTVTVENFLKNSGIPVASPALAAAGVQVIASGTSQTGNGSGTTAETTVNIPGGVIGGYVSVTGSTRYGPATTGTDAINPSDGPATTGTDAINPSETPAKRKNRRRRKPNSNGPQITITLKITDPKKKIVGIEFQDTRGNKINDLGFSGINMFGTETKTYRFASPFPNDARLVIYLDSPNAYLKVPFSFTNLLLPSGGT